MNWWGRAVKKSKARGTLLEPSMVLSETSAAAAREDARRVLLRLELIKARATIRAMRIARELRA